MTLSRRHLLATLAMLSLPRPSFASAADAVGPLLDLLDDRQAAATLGGAWLKQTNQQPGVVLALLQSRLRGQGWSGEADRDALRNAMAASVADDFRTGDMVTIEGWQVAKAQAELCALAYFAETGSL